MGALVFRIMIRRSRSHVLLKTCLPDHNFFTSLTIIWLQIETSVWYAWMHTMYVMYTNILCMLCMLCVCVCWGMCMCVCIYVRMQLHIYVCTLFMHVYMFVCMWSIWMSMKIPFEINSYILSKMKQRNLANVTRQGNSDEAHWTIPNRSAINIIFMHEENV